MSLGNFIRGHSHVWECAELWPAQWMYKSKCVCVNESEMLVHIYSGFQCWRHKWGPWVLWAVNCICKIKGAKKKQAVQKATLLSSNTHKPTQSLSCDSVQRSGKGCNEGGAAGELSSQWETVLSSYLVWDLQTSLVTAELWLGLT